MSTFGPRTEKQIRTDLDAAQLRDRALRIGAPDYAANRRRIGVLIDELMAAAPLKLAKFTTADYENWPDSFEQMARNRERAEGRERMRKLVEYEREAIYADAA